MNHTILNRLGFDPGDFLGEVEAIEEEDGIDYYAYLRKPGECPFCHSDDVIGYGRRARAFNVSINSNLRETLHVIRHRMKCNECGRLWVPAPSGTNRNQTLTLRGKTMIALDLKRADLSLTAIAKTYHVSVPYVAGILERAYGKISRGRMPRYLCIDEFGHRINGKTVFPAVIVDGDDGSLIDMVRSREYVTLSSYFSAIPKEELDRVEIFASDMHIPFRSLRKAYFPNAAHIVDPFHLVQLLNACLNHVRPELIKKATKEGDDCIEVRFAKQRWKCFLERKGELSHRKRFRPLSPAMSSISHYDGVMKCLGKWKELYAIYDALQALHDLLDGKSENGCLEDMGWIRNKLANSETECGLIASRTLWEWKEEISNLFKSREKGVFVSNSAAENMNSGISRLVTISKGMPNFKHLRIRCMAAFKK